MKLYKAFLLLTRAKQIGAVVCAVHLFAIFFLLGHHLISGRLKPPRPMVVKTIVHAERKMQNPKREEAVQVQKPKPAAPTKKGPQKKPAPVVKKAPPVDEEDTFLKGIAEGFQTFKTEAKKPPRAALNLPSAIQRKTQLTQAPNEDPTDSEFLIAYLQNALDLPEFGEVKAKLEIDRFGKLVDLQIIEAKSVKNAKFLQAELPLLDFPHLSESHTFTITFRNI